MIHGKPLTREELQKEVETQKQLMNMMGMNKPIIVAVHENPDGDGDHIASLLLAGLTALANEDSKNG